MAFWNDQTHLANETARYAVVNSCSPCSPGQTLNQAMIAQAESSTAKLGICYPNGASPSVGDPVHVTIKDTFQWIKLNFNNFMGVNFNPPDTDIYGDSEMRLENVTAPLKYTVGTWNAGTKHCDTP